MVLGEVDLAKCDNCSFDNPDEARFCSQCGSDLRAFAPQGERKQITVAFSDLSGFTALSEHMDPEDLRGVMREIFSKATEVIERFGGRVDKLLGDAVMSVFGDPVAHEDDAERAVRATLEIHALVDEISPRYEKDIGRPLEMHSGINTGVVITSAGALDAADTGPLGDTINVAARLEDLSKAGEILIGPETAAAVGGVFELEDHGEHALRGKAGPTLVKKVVGPLETRATPSRRQAGFVGRHEELGILLGAVENVRDGKGSVIGIRAEAGAGKTRLLAEFQSRVEGNVQWLEGRAYPYGENIPYAALVDLISNAIGVGERDTQSSISSKLRSEIGVLVEDVDRVLDPFVRLYGLPERPDAALEKDSFQDRLLESLLAVVGGLCRRAPTVLVLQDLHWADPSTVAIVRDLLEALSAPVVIIANYRPSFTNRLPLLREIELAPLSPRQTGEMVASLLGVNDPPPELLEFIVERTDGNPFYVEEIVNSLIETGTVQREGDGWRVTGSLTEADLPTSIRGVIAARIDRLDTDRRQILREASVVGREFLYDVIKRVATRTEVLDPSLADLEVADLIRERRHDADLEYFFKHALTQDVAYEGLLKAERVSLHARAARAIEVQFAERLEEVTETLAYHYRQGQVLDKAVHYLRAAGRKAMDRYALVEAEAHFDNGYQMLTEAESTTDRDRQLIELILDWAIVFYYRAHLLRLDDILVEHQQIVDRLEDERLRMWWLVWRGHAAGFRIDQTNNTGFLDEAEAIAERTGDETGLAYARTWLTWARFVTGDPLGAIETGRSIQAWARANRAIDPYPYFKSTITLVFALASAGMPEETAELCREVIAFGEAEGNNRCVAFGYQGLAFIAAVYGNYEEAIEMGRRSSSIAKDPIYRDTAIINAAAAATLGGHLDAASEAVSFLMDAEQTGTELPTPLVLSVARGMTDLLEGNLSEGMDRIVATREMAERNGRLWEMLYAELNYAGVLGRIATGEANASLKDLASNPRFLPYVLKARRDPDNALRAIIDRATKHNFNGAVIPGKVELAKVLIHGGETDEAREILDSVLEQIHVLGDCEMRRRVLDLRART
ncbi:MAG: adenylate/guanylate cyclase domain-containing protein [Acidimicrobiia bacterium]|nr:adenylate/guanylate cyclase domain-containing protein [Acidimicrobiia bacterium]